MLKHVTCSVPKQQIIETIVSEYDRTKEMVKEDPGNLRVQGRELALLDLLKLIPIYEYN